MNSSHYLSRLLDPVLKSALSFDPKAKKKVIILYGPRQVGKTTLVREIAKQYSGSKYFSCDHFDVREAFAYTNTSKLKGIVAGIPLLILDEAQRIENIGLTLKILADEYPETQVIATGSSSFDLSNHIKEPLTGRKKELFLFPFSYEELTTGLSSIERRRVLEEMLRFGGYPELLGKSDSEKQEYLNEVAGSYLFKDIFAFQQLKKPEMLVQLLQLLAFQIGSEVSFHELAQKLSVDQTVVQRYIHLLEEAFVIFRLGPLKRNLRNEIGTSRKIYFWDLGIRNALIQRFQPLSLRDDIGALWENFCIAERKKRNMILSRQPNAYFWRTYQQKEIDYLEESEGVISAFECKWSEKKSISVPKEFAAAYPECKVCRVSPDTIDDFLLSGE